MKAADLLKLIPADLFRDLAIETKVDSQVKKLSGEVMFKLILFSMLNSEKMSLRVMETFLQSAQFKSFTRFDILEGKYNSIRDRICTINAEYFEQLFEKIFSIYNKELKEEKALSKADSTCVSIAAKLASVGIDMGRGDKRIIKYAVNLKGSLPSSVKVFTDQTYATDQGVLSELLNEENQIKNDIVIFDRGLQSRKAFDKFTDDNKLFITRTIANTRGKVIEENQVPVKLDGSTVTINSDHTVLLITKKQKNSQHKYRIIKGTVDKSGEEIGFMTNIFDEDAYTIAAWYKQRWEIEVFFKFIKQHLNVKHLVSRTSNGMKVMIYMTMIVAMLIIAYKKINKIKGFKIAKLKFEIELENEIMKMIVIFCGGDPNRAPHLFNSG